MSINGIEAIPGLTGGLPGVGGLPQGLSAELASGFGQTLTPQVSGAEGISLQASGALVPTGPVGDQSFGALLTGSIDRLEGMSDKTDALAVQAATGDLGAIHDYTIAATETSVATQLAVSIRNKAVEAFNEIMRLPV